eukprot:1150776-Pelagomonas_calceolata.AAC.6
MIYKAEQRQNGIVSDTPAETGRRWQDETSQAGWPGRKRVDGTKYGTKCQQNEAACHGSSKSTLPCLLVKHNDDMTQGAQLHCHATDSRGHQHACAMLDSAGGIDVMQSDKVRTMLQSAWAAPFIHEHTSLKRNGHHGELAMMQKHAD